MPSNSSSSTSDQAGGVLPALTGVSTAPVPMPTSPNDDVLTPLSSTDVSPAVLGISEQTSIATAAIDARPPPAIASMFAESGSVSVGSKIQGDRSASSSSVLPIKTQLQPAPSTSNPTLSAVPTTTAAISLPRGPGGFGRHRELVYSRPGSLAVSKSGDDGASDEWQTTIRASTSTAGGLSALATGDPSADANGTGTARRRPHSFHAGSLESSRPPALVEPIRRAPLGAAGGEYRPPSTYLVSDPTLFDGGLVSTPTAAGLETATTARAGASQVDHQAAYFHELHLQQQQQQEHYQRMAQASATAAREQQQQLSQHRGGAGVYLPYPPRQATGLASSMPPSYRNYPPPGPAQHHESPYGRPYPDAIEYAPYPSQYHQHPHLTDSPAGSSPSQPARHRGALPFPMTHRSVSNTSTASNQSCDPSFLQPSSTGYRNAGDDSDWSTSSTGGGDPNGVDSSGEYSHSYSSTSVSGGEERLTDLEDDVDVLRYPGAGTPALYGGAGGRPTAMHTDSEDDGEDELDDDEKDGDYLDSSPAAARLHARGSGSSKAKRRRDAALLPTSATIPQRVYTATPPHSMPPSSTHGTPYSYGTSQQQGHYPPPRPHHPHESPQHYSYAHGHPPYGQPQPYPPTTYSRDYSPPPSQLIPITAYDLGDQQIYQQHYSSAPQLPVVGGGVSTANAVTGSRTKGARRAAKPSKIPAPQIVPNLNKRSRGRHVPVDPYLVRQKKGGNGRVYECAVPECGKCFGRSEHLKRHIRSLHTNEKPFPCPHPNCSKEFSRHDNLCQHFRIHRQNPADQAAMEGLDMSRLGVGSASDSNHSGSRRSSGVSATSNTSKGSNEGYDDDEDDDQEGEDADEGFLSE